MTAPPIRPIRDKAGYEAALADVHRLWGTAPGMPDGDRLDVLMVLVEAYEAERHPIPQPDPIEAIKTRMADLALSRDDLRTMLGVSSGRLSELLTRRRPLTLPMIRTLAAELSLPEACLVQPYDLVPPSRTRGRPKAVAQHPAKDAA